MATHIFQYKVGQPPILLMHADNNYDDASYVDRVLTTNNGTLAFSTTSKFGSHSLDFNPNNAYLSSPYTADLCPRTATTWSVDAWINVADYNNKIYPAGGQPNMIGIMWPTGAANDWSFGITNTGVVRFYYYNGSPQYVTGTTPVGTSQWVHIAVTKDSNNYRVFRDGNLEATAGDAAGTTFCGTDLILGAYRSNYFTGLVDEVRITRDIPVWTTNFTPSTSPY